jgi:hypothetical protein
LSAATIGALKSAAGKRPSRGRLAIGPADVVIELVFLGQQLAKARTADGEMLAHQRGNLVQRGGGVIIAQHVGDLEAQGDPGLPPGDLVKHPFQPGRAQGNGQDQQRDRGNQHGEHGLPHAARSHVGTVAMVHRKDRRPHPGIVHAGNRQPHQPGCPQPHAQAWSRPANHSAAVAAPMAITTEIASQTGS